MAAAAPVRHPHRHVGAREARLRILLVYHTFYEDANEFPGEVVFSMIKPICLAPNYEPLRASLSMVCQCAFTFQVPETLILPCNIDLFDTMVNRWTIEQREKYFEVLRIACKMMPRDIAFLENINKHSPVMDPDLPVCIAYMSQLVMELKRILHGRPLKKKHKLKPEFHLHTTESELRSLLISNFEEIVLGLTPRKAIFKKWNQLVRCKDTVSISTDSDSFSFTVREYFRYEYKRYMNILYRHKSPILHYFRRRIKQWIADGVWPW